MPVKYPQLFTGLLSPWQVRGGGPRIVTCSSTLTLTPTLTPTPTLTLSLTPTLTPSRRVPVDLPDAEGRLEIIKVHPTLTLTLPLPLPLT